MVLHFLRAVKWNFVYHIPARQNDVLFASDKRDIEQRCSPLVLYPKTTIPKCVVLYKQRWDGEKPHLHPTLEWSIVFPWNNRAAELFTKWALPAAAWLGFQPFQAKVPQNAIWGMGKSLLYYHLYSKIMITKSTVWYSNKPTKAEASITRNNFPPPH